MTDSVPTVRHVAVVARRLRGIRRWHRASLLAEAALVGLGLAALLFWLNAMAAVRYAPGRWIALLLLAASVVLVAAAVWWALRPLRRRCDALLDTARRVERRRPPLYDRLSSALELSRAPADWRACFSPALLERAYADAARVGRRVPRPVLVWRRRLGLTLIVSLLLVASPWFLTLHTAYTVPDLWRIYLSTLSSATVSVLLVEPGNVTIAAGEDVVVRATAFGRALRSAELYFRAGATGGEYVPMRRVDGDAFVAALRSLRSDTVYSVRTDAGRSDEFTIAVGQVPALEYVRVHYDYPDYTGVPSGLGPEGEGDIRAVAGTVAQVLVRYDLPLVSARVFLDTGRDGRGVPGTPARDGGRTALALARSGDGWAVSFPVEADGTYTLVGRGAAHGLESPGSTYTIDAVPDATPAVHLAGVEPWLPRPADGRFRFAYAATDDFGLRSVDLVWRTAVTDADSRVALRSFGPGIREVSASYVWQLPEVGDAQIVLWLEASDHREAWTLAMGRSKTVRIGGARPEERVEASEEREDAGGSDEGRRGGGESSRKGEGARQEAAISRALSQAAEHLEQAAATANAAANRLESGKRDTAAEPGAQSDVAPQRDSEESGRDAQRIRRGLSEAGRALQQALEIAAMPPDERAIGEREPGEDRGKADGGSEETNELPAAGELRERGEDIAAQAAPEQAERRPGAPQGHGDVPEGLRDREPEPPRGTGGRGERPVATGEPPAARAARVGEQIKGLLPLVQSSYPMPPAADSAGPGQLDREAADIHNQATQGRRAAAARTARGLAGQLESLAAHVARLNDQLNGRRDDGPGQAPGAEASSFPPAGEDARDEGAGSGREPFEVWAGETGPMRAPQGKVISLGGGQRDYADRIKDAFGPARSDGGQYGPGPGGTLPVVETTNYPEEYREAVADYFDRIRR